MAYAIADPVEELPGPKTDLIPVPSRAEKIRWLKRRCFHHRRQALTCVKVAGSGHMGGAMSCAEILGVL
jgi:hypothetical protein